MMENIRQKMMAALGLTPVQTSRLIARSPYTYKVYSIPKKTGGIRTIAQPAKETKVIQHWLIENVFPALPIHACATAYKRGASIKINAASHANGTYVSKFDFRNFFPSISEKDLASHFEIFLGNSLSRMDIAWISRVSCIKSTLTDQLSLSIGAPSSPLLSNSVMYEFDVSLSDWCTQRRITYTRYADDLTFSSEFRGIGKDIEMQITELRQTIAYPKLEINEKKTTHVSKKHQRRITGIIINNEGQLSLGRDRKRLISSLIHNFTLNKLPLEESLRLQGLLGFARDVEPVFLASMEKKYGSQVVQIILQLRKDSAKS